MQSLGNWTSALDGFVLEYPADQVAEEVTVACSREHYDGGGDDSDEVVLDEE
jgi:hypothetical protein